jgi:hypothetical protein
MLERKWDAETGVWKNIHDEAAEGRKMMQYPTALKVSYRDPFEYYRETSSGSYKFRDFTSNCSGNYDVSTMDRWMARILLHTDDEAFAKQMINANSAAEGRYGYDRMQNAYHNAIERVRQDYPERFGEMNRAAGQAITWCVMVGQDGSIAIPEEILEDLKGKKWRIPKR